MSRHSGRLITVLCVPVATALAQHSWQQVDGPTLCGFAFYGAGAFVRAAADWSRDRLVVSDQHSRLYEFDGQRWLDRGISAPYLASVHDPNGDRTLFLQGPTSALALVAWDGMSMVPLPGLLNGNYSPNATAFLHFDVLDAPTPGLAAVSVALAVANHPLGQGCALLVQQVLGTRLNTQNGAGFASIRFTIPSSSALRGIVLHAQGAAFDPNAALGFALTSGITATIGD